MSLSTDIRWQPDDRRSVSMSTGDLGIQPDRAGKRELAACSPLTLKRLSVWTSDLRAFSRAVLACARPTPPSNAYLLGNVRCGEGGFLDSGLGGSPEDVALSSVPNPAHAFRLQWHRAFLHEKLPDTRLPTEVMDELTRCHSIQTLYDISTMVAKDANYCAQPARYPGLTWLLKNVKTQ